MTRRIGDGRIGDGANLLNIQTTRSIKLICCIVAPSPILARFYYVAKLYVLATGVSNEGVSRLREDLEQEYQKHEEDGFNDSLRQIADERCEIAKKFLETVGESDYN